MSNSVLWYTTRGAGVITLILLTAVVVLGILSALRAQSPNWPQFLTAELQPQRRADDAGLSRAAHKVR